MSIGPAYPAENGSGAFANNEIIINQLSDLPTPVGGTHTLPAGHYTFAGVVTTPDFFTCLEGVVITSWDRNGPLLTFSGTGTMFVGVDVTANIHDLNTTCPTAKSFDFSETSTGGLKTLNWNNVNVVASTKAGTCAKMGLLNFEAAAWFDSDDGITITGTVTTSISFDRSAILGTGTSFIGFDITGTTGIIAFDITRSRFSGGAGSIGLKGDSGSTNMADDTIGAVVGTSFGGVVTALSGITQDDVRWDFQGNSITPDTQPDSMISLNANTTATVITTIDTPVLVAGTWVDERKSQFTNTAAGRMTYNGERPVTTPIQAVVVARPLSGANKTVRAYIALNGTVIANSGKSILIETGDATSITLLWQLQLVEDDFLEVFIENKTDTIDIEVSDAILLAR